MRGRVDSGSEGENSSQPDFFCSLINLLAFKCVCCWGREKMKARNYINIFLGFFPP